MAAGIAAAFSVLPAVMPLAMLAPILAKLSPVALPIPPLPPADQHGPPCHRAAVDLWHVRAPCRMTMGPLTPSVTLSHFVGR